MTVTVRRLKNGCKIEDADQQVSARINNDGLWCTFRTNQGFYRRCMDGRVVKGAEATAVGSAEADQLYRQFLQWVQQLDDTDDSVVKSQRLSLEDYQRQARLYRQTYPEDVAILPPDRYGDIVIMPAVGCPNRKCTFCAFYQEKPYRVLNKQVFAAHLRAIRDFHGQTLMSARGVFLGSANAMALSQRRLLFCLEQIKEQLGLFKREVATFADPDFSPRRTLRDWEALRELGLQQIVIGLETGWAELRASLGKSGDFSNILKDIRQARASGMTVGLTVLTGITGDRDREKNLKSTLATIASFGLSDKDRIYLSPLSTHGCVDNVALKEQALFIELLPGVSDAKAVPYQMQRFHYFA